MPYIPKNKIQTDLYTLGEELMFAEEAIKWVKSGDLEGNFYIGYYHKLYNGKYYTGKNPNDPSPIRELIKVKDSDFNLKGDIHGEEEASKQYYINANIYNLVFPTDQDYKIGEYTRYFTIRRNQPVFAEITKEAYTQFKQKSNDVSWKLHRVFSIPWLLTGNIKQVSLVNKNITELTEFKESVRGLSVFLKQNWTQFYKYNEASNLYTDGKTEPILKTKSGNINALFLEKHLISDGKVEAPAKQPTSIDAIK
jgi:hypothetical protein